ncbi:MAG: hypothetical protein Ct9H300mP9_4170 [Candidatus Neomarinimicrobiota bacterium]|nr:MAG: hypothetical protein Ct9H300mP9_4170 [Candidatus Neomarinimicrobiota bacterium]
MVALLTDRSGYFDIYLLDAQTGKKKRVLVKGSRSVDFEELKWLQPGISWSPDNRRMCSLQKQAKGMYFILSMCKRKIQKR